LDVRVSLGFRASVSPLWPNSERMSSKSFLMTELGEDVVEVVLDDPLGLPVKLLHLGLEAEPLLLVGHPLQYLLEAPLG